MTRRRLWKREKSEKALETGNPRRADEPRGGAEAEEVGEAEARAEAEVGEVKAEAEVPRALASALREGKLGVMDYYQMQIIISDTQMRGAIASADDKTPKEG